ncbi:MAG: hypothetical protein P1P77_03630 [Spirochaetaceae bacterium]|nr:hypothetical protein [Spirochaetaceae bacterium]
MIRANRSEILPDYLDTIFADGDGQLVNPDPSDVEGFEQFFKRYHAGLGIEAAAVDSLKN